MVSIYCLVPNEHKTEHVTKSEARTNHKPSTSWQQIGVSFYFMRAIISLNQALVALWGQIPACTNSSSMSHEYQSACRQRKSKDGVPYFVPLYVGCCLSSVNFWIWLMPFNNLYYFLDVSYRCYDWNEEKSQKYRLKDVGNNCKLTR